MSLLARTKKIAKSKGFSLTELALKSGLAEKSIYSWDRSNPKVENIQKVARTLGVSVDYLLGNTTEMHSDSKPDSEIIDLREVSDEERYDLISAGGRPITDDDWAVIKAVLAKYPKKKG